MQSVERSASRRVRFNWPGLRLDSFRRRPQDRSSATSSGETGDGITRTDRSILNRFTHHAPLEGPIPELFPVGLFFFWFLLSQKPFLHVRRGVVSSASSVLDIDESSIQIRLPQWLSEAKKALWKCSITLIIFGMKSKKTFVRNKRQIEGRKKAALWKYSITLGVLL